MEVDKLFYEIEDNFINNKNNTVKDIYISITDNGNSDYGYKNIDKNNQLENESMDIDKNIEIETSNEHILGGMKGLIRACK